MTENYCDKADFYAKAAFYTKVDFYAKAAFVPT
jgi:hypothetical protein